MAKINFPIQLNHYIQCHTLLLSLGKNWHHPQETIQRLVFSSYKDWSFSNYITCTRKAIRAPMIKSLRDEIRKIRYDQNVILCQFCNHIPNQLVGANRRNGHSSFQCFTPLKFLSPQRNLASWNQTIINNKSSCTKKKVYGWIY